MNPDTPLDDLYELERIHGDGAEAVIHPYERGPYTPKLVLTVGDREVDLADIVDKEHSPETKAWLQEAIDDMHARYGKPK